MTPRDVDALTVEEFDRFTRYIDHHLSNQAQEG